MREIQRRAFAQQAIAPSVHKQIKEPLAKLPRGKIKEYFSLYIGTEHYFKGDQRHSHIPPEPFLAYRLPPAHLRLRNPLILADLRRVH